MENNTPTLVLMPGLDGTGLLFERLVMVLPADVKIHIVRYPNHTMLTLDDYVSLVMRDLPEGPVVLLAESFSGLIALRLLLQYPKRFEKVIFVATPFQPPVFLRLISPLLGSLFRTYRLIPNFCWRFFCLGMRASDLDIARLKGVLAQVSHVVLAHRLKLLISVPLNCDMPIDIPTLYIQPHKDRLVDCHVSEVLKRCFTKYTVLKVAGPHFVLQSVPLDCAQIIAEIITPQKTT